MRRASTRDERDDYRPAPRDEYRHYRGLHAGMVGTKLG